MLSWISGLSLEGAAELRGTFKKSKQERQENPEIAPD
jgi:hypothetical protein